MYFRRRFVLLQALYLPLKEAVRLFSVFFFYFFFLVYCCIVPAARTLCTRGSTLRRTNSSPAARPISGSFAESSSCNWTGGGKRTPQPWHNVNTCPSPSLRRGRTGWRERNTPEDRRGFKVVSCLFVFFVFFAVIICHRIQRRKYQ